MGLGCPNETTVQMEICVQLGMVCLDSISVQMGFVCLDGSGVSRLGCPDGTAMST